MSNPRIDSSWRVYRHRRSLIQAHNQTRALPADIPGGRQRSVFDGCIASGFQPRALSTLFSFQGVRCILQRHYAISKDKEVFPWLTPRKALESRLVADLQQRILKLASFR